MDIEIGRGKRARSGYSLHDLSLVPARRTRDDEDVELAWQIDAFRLPTPVVAAPGHHASADGLTTRVLERADLDDPGPCRDALATVRDSGGVAGLSVHPTLAVDAQECIRRLEPDVLFVSGSIVSAEHVSQRRETLNLKQWVRSMEMPVVAGACASYRSALHLMRTGAAAVLIGSVPDGRSVGVPLATAIADTRAARMRHLDETGVYVHLIAASDVVDGDDAAVTIACGADAVMVAADDVDAPAGPIASRLRRSMARCGYETPKEMQDAELVVVR